MVAAMSKASSVPSLPPMLGDPSSHSVPSTRRSHGRSAGQLRERRGAALMTSSRSAETVSMASGRSGRSHGQVQRGAAVPLPPIMQARKVVSFEDMYSAARVRVAKKSALGRAGGKSPHLLRSCGALPSYPGSLGSGGAVADLPAKQTRAAEWAAAALACVPGQGEPQPKDGDGAGSAVSGSRTGSKRVSIASQPAREDQTYGESRTAKVKSFPDSNEADKTGIRVSVAPGTDPVLVELLENISARVEGSKEGFTDKEVERLHGAFNRFKIPGESDLYTADIFGLLSYLGHVMTQSEGVMSVVREVTMYDYMDFTEFLTFMEKFMAFERDQFRNKFEEFDEDGSGEISVQELRGLLKALGFTPMRQMIHEAIGIVDQDSNGTLSFDELCKFLGVYCYREGFTEGEVAEIRRQFDRFSVVMGGRARGSRMLPPEALSDAMVQIFGLGVSEFTQSLGQQLASGQGLQKSSFDHAGGEPECMNFNEFLIFARKVRENELATCKMENPGLIPDVGNDEKEEFQKADLDRSGGISERELRRVMTKRGYTPLRAVIDEIMRDVCDDAWDPERSELDFEEFFDFMMILYRRDGFTISELDELRKIYERFDEDGSGEVSALECSALFRHVGYRVDLEDLRDHISEVDANASGQLDFREFLRLMRLYREKELAKVKAAFDEKRDRSTDAMPVQPLPEALESLGSEPPFPQWPSEKGDRLNFDDLVALVDSCRSEFVTKERKKAGFTDEDVEMFEEMFNKFDRDKSGSIDNKELQNILKEFNWEPKTREEQDALMRQMDEARDLAREAGVADVGEDGSPNITFWTFVQLARMLRSQQERVEEERMAALQKELGFSDGETEEFRQVFRHWVRVLRGMREPSPASAARPRSQQAPEELSRDGVRRLLRSLGVSVSAANADVLDAQIQSLDEEHRLETAMLPFDAFLRLMRWLLDTNFAGINEAAECRRA